MAKVWVAFDERAWDEASIHGVFSREEDARRASDHVEEFEIDEQANWEVGDIHRIHVHLMTGVLAPHTPLSDVGWRHPSECVVLADAAGVSVWVHSPISAEHAQLAASELRRERLKELGYAEPAADDAEPSTPSPAPADHGS